MSQCCFRAGRRPETEKRTRRPLSQNVVVWLLCRTALRQQGLDIFVLFFVVVVASTACQYLVTRSYRSLQSARGRLTWGKQYCLKTVGKVSVSWLLLGGSGGVVNSLDFCPASLKSLGCFYFRCLLSSQWKAVTVTLRILHCQTFLEACSQNVSGNKQ